MTEVVPYLHSIDPFAIQFTETFGIRWYGLSYMSGFICGYLSILWMLNRRPTPFRVELLSDFVFITAIGCIAGGRLGYCVFYRPELLVQFTSSAPFWGVFAFHEGGMASHGGMIGMILACLWFGWRHKLPFFHLMDLTILGSTIGIFFGRIANFINGELVGRACDGACRFPVQFPQDIFSWGQYEPQRLSSLLPALKQLGISQQEWQGWFMTNNIGAIHKALTDIVFAVQSGNEQVRSVMREVLTPRYPSQLYAAVLEGGGIFLLLFLLWRKPQKPGVIASGFFILYSIGRILGEQFRQPDLHLGFQAMGLTRGQWLSVGLIVFGLLLLFISLYSKSEPLGGWGLREQSEE